MSERLTGADRATLRAWQASNIAGWSLVALSLSLFLRWGFESAASLLDHSLADVFDWLGYWEYAVGVIVPSSVLCGCLIGSLIGTRVYLWPALVSGGVSVLYAVIVWIIMASVDVPRPAHMRLVGALLTALAILVAVVVAQHIARTRSSTPVLRDFAEEHPH